MFVSLNLGFRCQTGNSPWWHRQFDGLALHYSWQDWGALFSLLIVSPPPPCPLSAFIFNASMNYLWLLSNFFLGARLLEVYGLEVNYRSWSGFSLLNMLVMVCPLWLLCFRALHVMTGAFLISFNRIVGGMESRYVSLWGRIVWGW